MPFIRAYLRASTLEQDAARAKQQLEEFAAARGLEIASFYYENESGARLNRPELMRLIADCKKGDMLLVEQIDRLSRLKEDDWDKLRSIIKDRGIKIVSLDLPTTWEFTKAKDDINARILHLLSEMLLDLLAAFARKDYEDRRRRQSQGIAKAKELGAYKGRKPNVDRNSAIRKMLAAQMSWGDIQKATGCSRTTIANIRKIMKNDT